MKYDPVMCMMVPDTVKTKDAQYILMNGRKYKVLRREGGNVLLSYNGVVTKWPVDTLMERGKVVNDSECKELTMDSEEYNNWLRKNETEASNENLVKYLVEVKGFTKENAKKYAKGRIHDVMNNAIRNCDEAQYYEFTLKDGSRYYGTESDLREFMSHLTKEERKTMGAVKSKTPKTKQFVEEWRGKALLSLW